jgi:hypothetical protein
MDPESLAAFNQVLGLPEQDPREITFNSSNHLARQLLPFELPVFPNYPDSTVPFERLSRPFRQETVIQFKDLLPEDLNIVYTIINPSANTIWIRSFKSNRRGIGVVERHIFFHTGTPFSSLDSIFSSGRTFRAIPFQQRTQGPFIGNGVCFVNSNLLNHFTR